MKKAQAGFTIVELLIVIIVIAILASISIVAYNGIQSRAEQTANYAAIRSYTQALQIMKSDTGSLPAANSCLGPAGSYAGGTCSFAGQNGTVNTTTNNSLALYGPSASSQPAVKKSGSQTVVMFVPIFYSEPALLWQVRDTQDCTPSPGRFAVGSTWTDGLTYSSRSGGATNCYMSLKDL
ncbi:MAG TPA: prepilin-type N-terminal cleavage/methylation domain-containing protein [Candidatus Saccharimonadales bacterium]